MALHVLVIMQFDEYESLETIEIPDSVTSIGDHAFEDCESLETVYVYKNSYAHRFIENNYSYLNIKFIDD